MSDIIQIVSKIHCLYGNITAGGNNMSDEQKTTESMQDFSKELENSYKMMGDGEHDTDTLLAWEKIKEYMDQKTVLDLSVYEIVNKGVIVMVEGLRGFIPASRLDVKHVEDLNSWLDRPVKARVIEADMEKGKLVLSAREVIREQQREEKRLKMKDVKVGDVRKGVVDSIQDYGVFVDLGDDMSGLLHISQISTKHLKHPGEVLKEGQEITVKVIKNQNGKIGLSMRALTEDKEKAEEAAVKIPKAENIGTSLGDLFKNIKL